MGEARLRLACAQDGVPYPADIPRGAIVAMAKPTKRLNYIEPSENKPRGFARMIRKVLAASSEPMTLAEIKAAIGDETITGAKIGGTLHGMPDVAREGVRKSYRYRLVQR